MLVEVRLVSWARRILVHHKIVVYILDHHSLEEGPGLEKGGRI